MLHLYSLYKNVFFTVYSIHLHLAYDFNSVKRKSTYMYMKCNQKRYMKKKETIPREMEQVVINTNICVLRYVNIYVNVISIMHRR